MSLLRSPSMRGRGLKLTMAVVRFPVVHVALHAGAWIETPPGGGVRLLGGVALHAGAWIETRGWVVVV